MTKEILQQWMELVDALAVAKAKEMLLRKMIVAHMGPASCTKEFFGVELKSEVKVSYSVDKKLLNEAIDEAKLFEDELEAIKWTPTIVVKRYNALEGGELKSTIVTIKPVAPTLKVLSELA